MEVLAENRFTITKSLFYEGMLLVSAQSYGKMAKKAVLFLFAAWIALTVVTLWRHQSVGYIVIEFIVSCLAALWIAVYMPRRKAKRAFKALEDKCGDNMERITRFYDDRLEVEASERRTVVFYSEIAQVLRSKRLLVLVAEDQTGILLGLDGFTRGDETAVRELIETKKTEENEDD